MISPGGMNEHVKNISCKLNHDGIDINLYSIEYDTKYVYSSNGVFYVYKLTNKGNGCILYASASDDSELLILPV